MTKSEPQHAASPLVSERLPVREVDWSSQEVEQKLQAFHLRKSRGPDRRFVWAAAALCAAVVGTFVLLYFSAGDVSLPRQSQSFTPSGETSAPLLVDDQRFEGKGLVRFADGSQAELRESDSQLVVQKVSAQVVKVELTRGQGTFRVTPRPERQFTVLAQGVEVAVIGTEFSVSHQPGRVHVAVVHGKVRVKSAREARTLIGGEAAWFDVGARKSAENNAGKPASVEEQTFLDEQTSRVQLALIEKQTSRLQPSDAAPALRRRYIQLHQEAAYAEAYRVLSEKREVVGVTDQDLMRAADVARYSGHAAEALEFLGRVSLQGTHGPTAAFTRGRLLFHELNRPAEAAQAFAEVQRLASAGPLAEDALFREMEARAQAGQKAQVRRLAQIFAERYPQSRRREAVKQLMAP